jgi:hypothetical protein
MQYLIQQAQAAQAKQTPSKAQSSFATALGTASGEGSLSQVTLATLANGTSAVANTDTASAMTSKLLDIIT